MSKKPRVITQADAYDWLGKVAEEREKREESMTRARRCIVKDWVKEIKKHEDALAKERDRIDKSIGKMQDLKDVCEQAYDNLQMARDVLSSLV